MSHRHSTLERRIRWIPASGMLPLLGIGMLILSGCGQSGSAPAPSSSATSQSPSAPSATEDPAAHAADQAKSASEQSKSAMDQAKATAGEAVEQAKTAVEDASAKVKDLIEQATVALANKDMKKAGDCIEQLKGLRSGLSPDLMKQIDDLVKKYEAAKTVSDMTGGLKLPGR